MGRVAASFAAVVLLLILPGCSKVGEQDMAACRLFAMNIRPMLMQAYKEKRASTQFGVAALAQEPPPEDTIAKNCFETLKIAEKKADSKKFECVRKQLHSESGFHSYDGCGFTWGEYH